MTIRRHILQDAILESVFDLDNCDASLINLKHTLNDVKRTLTKAYGKDFEKDSKDYFLRSDMGKMKKFIDDLFINGESLNKKNFTAKFKDCVEKHSLTFSEQKAFSDIAAHVVQDLKKS